MDKQKNNFGKLIIIIVVVFILAIICILFTTGIIKFGHNSDNNAPILSSDNTIKLNSSKEYVYDADYKYDNKYKEFSRGDYAVEKDRTIDQFGVSIKLSNKELLKNLKVPYININSNDATKVNIELEKLYKDYAKEFDTCALDMQKGGNQIGCSLILTYGVFTNNDILSILVIDSAQATSAFVYNYHTYNFDLNNGNLLTYDEMASKLGYNKDTLLNTIKDQIKEKMDALDFKGYNFSNGCHSGNSIYGTTNCYDIANKLLDSAIDDNKLLFFADKDGYLNILQILYNDYVQDGNITYDLIKVNK